MKLLLGIILSLPLIGVAGLITNIPPFLTGDPLDIGHQAKPTNYNTWGYSTTKTNTYKWRDDNLRQRFNALYTNMVMETNGIITKKK